MRSETNLFRLTSAAEALLVDLLAPSGEGRLLIAAFDPHLGSRYAPDATKIVLEQSPEDMAGQVDAFRASSPYTGALIVPPFNIEIPPDAARSPTGWSQRRWFAEEYLIAHAWTQLAPGARLAAFVLPGLLFQYQRKDTRRALIEHGLRLVAKLPSKGLWESLYTTVSIYLVVLTRQQEAVRPIAMVEMDTSFDLPPVEALTNWLQGEPYSDIEMRVVNPRELGEDIRLDPGYHSPTYLELRPPPGFSEHRLGDIADFIVGIRVAPADRLTEPPADGGIPYVQIRHLRTDGTIDDQPYWLGKEQADPHLAKRAMPGDILVSGSGTIGKVMLVGPDHSGGVLFDTSLRRVRITNQDIKPEAVAEFMRSELGQMQFRQLTTGSVISYLSIALLAQMRVFLPLPSDSRPTEATTTAPGEAPPAPLSPEQMFAQTVESELDTILTQLRARHRSDSPDWRMSVAEKLRQVVSLLMPTPLGDRVRQEFPAPLAIAYRRYHMARHNPYEQLDRMINLVEACTYFVFYVLLANYTRDEWHDGFALSKQAKEALKSHASFDSRIKFIRDLTSHAREHRLDLFVPGLIDCQLDLYADDFRLELRNPVAHSAPGSEEYVKKLVQHHHGKLHEMLEQLEFLTAYKMCRVRSHYFQQGRWHYQCELYQGEEYDVNVQEMQLGEAEQDGRLIAADRNHLVLLGPDYEALDLWPYYQLHFNDAGRESHLCFVKHFSAGSRKLHGESIRSGVELELPGFDDYFRPTTAVVKP